MSVRLTCKVCGRRYAAARSDQCYCSNACRQKAKRARGAAEEAASAPSELNVELTTEPEQLEALAVRARVKADEFIRLGRGREAQACAIVAGIALDKARQLRKELREQHDFELELAEEQAQRARCRCSSLLGREVGRELAGEADLVAADARRRSPRSSVSNSQTS